MQLAAKRLRLFQRRKNDRGSLKWCRRRSSSKIEWFGNCDMSVKRNAFVFFERVRNAATELRKVSASTPRMVGRIIMVESGVPERVLDVHTCSIVSHLVAVGEMEDEDAYLVSALMSSERTSRWSEARRRRQRIVPARQQGKRPAPAIYKIESPK